jgi:hypothetical protein
MAEGRLRLKRVLLPDIEQLEARRNLPLCLTLLNQERRLLMLVQDIMTRDVA